MHAAEYCLRGACVSGVDFSRTMIQRAISVCQKGRFCLGNMKNLPYKNNSFDIVTASSVVCHVDDLAQLFSEVRLVVRDDGFFVYSDLSPFSLARERKDDELFSSRAIGHIRNKKTGEFTSLGRCWEEGTEEIELLSGMKIMYHRRFVGTHVRALASAGFYLADYVDCKPILELKKYDAVAYDLFNHFPVFSIYVARKNLRL